MKWPLALALLSLGSWAASALAQDNFFLNPPPNTFFQRFEKALPKFQLKQPLKSEDFQAYLNFYQLQFPNTEHFAGTLELSFSSNFVHVIKPAGPSQGTLVALHGYFVHSGLLQFLIQEGIEKNYTLVVMDLPGHGLSTGERVSIDDFSHYAASLKALTEQVVKKLPEPYYLIGHSTGGAGAWEYCLQERDHPYERLVLVAPLVRSRLWGLSMAGIEMGQHFVKEVPRILTPTSSDSSFHEMIKRDPLQYAGTPVPWVRALKNWNERTIEAYPPGLTPTLMIQGLDDSVVEWEYNIPFLSRKFPVHQLRLIPRGRHDLFWDAPAIRQKVFQEIFQFIS